MKLMYAIGITAIVIIGLYAVVSTNQATTTNDQTSNTSVEQDVSTSPQPETNEVALKSGRYIDYDANEVKSANYNKTILFFYASWCPECRAFESAIKSSAIPDGVQILKVDYDSSSELKKKYGVTLQTSFVKVDSDSNKLSLWVGYEKDKTIDIILENT